MSKLTVGIIDYGVGNHASVRQSIHEIGIRCRVSDQVAILDICDILLLPGVGAFSPAMHAIRELGMDKYLCDQAGRGRPIIGFCLGMQLLTDSSIEGGKESGLGLIPGNIVRVGPPYSHIGWNSIEVDNADPLLQDSDGDSFFFNHSYCYHGPIEYQVARTTLGTTRFGSAIRRDNVIGLQFHPEKSQRAGRDLLRRLLLDLYSA